MVPENLNFIGIVVFIIHCSDALVFAQNDFNTTQESVNQTHPVQSHSSLLIESELDQFNHLVEATLNSSDTGRRKRDVNDSSSLSLSQPNPDVQQADLIQQINARDRRGLKVNPELLRSKRDVQDSLPTFSQPTTGIPNQSSTPNIKERQERATNVVSERNEEIARTRRSVDDSSLSLSQPNPDLPPEDPSEDAISRKRRDVNFTNSSDNDESNILEAILEGKNKTRENITESEAIELANELTDEQHVMGGASSGPQEISSHGVLKLNDVVQEDKSKEVEGTNLEEIEESIIRQEAEIIKDHGNATESLLDNVDENKLLWIKVKEEEEEENKIKNDTDNVNKRTTVGRKKRNARVRRFLGISHDLRWTKGVVPYRLDVSIDESAEHEILTTMRLYEKYTCIRFIPHEGETTREKYQLDHDGFLIFVNKNNGCWAAQGNRRQKTGQEISCCRRGVCLHEIGHALGLYHEHQSPVSTGWNRINWNNIKQSAYRWYKEIPMNNTLTFGYDFTNPMHYGQTAFGNGNGPTQSILFKELESISKAADNPFYLFSEVSRSHQCGEVYCPDFKGHCLHGGYLTLVDGVCSCNCPTGLDPNTNCADTVKHSPPKVQWPKGQYAMFSPVQGCPKGFKSGTIEHHSVGKSFVRSPFNLSGDYTDTSFKYEFCVIQSENKEGSDWEPGQYCVFRVGGVCPRGFEEGFVQFGDVPGSIVTSGPIPDSKVEDHVGLQVCCRNDGFIREPIRMPLDNPFVLLPYNFRQGCQQVQGAASVPELMAFANDDTGTARLSGETKFILDIYNKYRIHFCYYVPYKRDCGGLVTLTTKQPEIKILSPGYPESYDNNQECTWLIEGPANSNLLLNFDDFDFESGDNRCKDNLEIRYNQIGQTGFSFCGDKLDKSIRSINNFIVLWMKTDMSVTKKGFSATVTLIEPKDLCYNASDHGQSYRGTVNYDREFTPCLPWSDVTNCPNHQFTSTGSGALLEDNYCRNPDKTFRPWCYIQNDGGQCMRNYCDVCGFESTYDKDPNCEKLKAEGFCSKPRSEVLDKCAKACQITIEKAELASTKSCSPPEVPSDSDMEDQLQEIYQVGSKVSFRCKTGQDKHSISCLTDGSWSPAKYTCGACSTGWTRHSGKCYKYFPGKLSFVEAEKTCQGFGGNVADVKSKEDEDFMTSVRTKTLRIWIGLTDREEEGKFQWSDGSSLAWENWSEGSPSSLYANEDCVVMYGEQVDNVWNDHPCSSQYYKYSFICQYSPTERQVCVNRRDDCRKLLENYPTMCSEYPNYSAEYCPIDCSICSHSSTTGVVCQVEPAPDNTKLETTDPEVNVGQTVTYSCQQEYVKDSGDLQRVCLVDGTLSGHLPLCKSANSVIQPNSNVELLRHARVGNLCKMYTSNNENFRINREGEIIQWEFYSLYSGDAALVVFRSTDDPFSYKLVGINKVFNTMNDGVQTLEIPAEDRISVQAGDQIGLWYAYKRAGIAFDFCDGAQRPEAANTLQINGFMCNANHLQVDRVYEFSSNRVMCRVFSFRAIIGPISGK